MILVEMLHIFIMIVIIGFGVACLFGGAGRFDHWNGRLKKKQNRFQ